MKKEVKISWGSLSKKEQATFGNGCGIMATAFLVPDFIFSASCRQHDFYFARGGGVKDFFKANLGFYAAMLTDIVDNQESLLKLFFYFLCATLYFSVVSTVGVFSFKWGKYKTLEEILKNDNASN